MVEKKPELKDVKDPKERVLSNAKVVRPGVGAERKIVITTDGTNIHIAEMTVSPLEVCEIFTRIIKRYRGDS